MARPHFIALLEGPQTLGRGRLFWAGALLVLLIAIAYPLMADGYTVGNTVYFFTWTFMALGLCLIWGYGGILSFGQTAFFGLSGYAYGVITLNFGAAYGLTLFALVLALVCSALFAAVLGYFLFFGRISGIFLGTAPAAAILGVVKATMTSWLGQLAGQIGLLMAVIVVIRVLPKGISGFILRERS